MNGKRVVFTTRDSDWHARSGSVATVIEPFLDADDEVGPMWVIQFDDGHRTQAFEDELQEFEE